MARILIVEDAEPAIGRRFARITSSLKADDGTVITAPGWVAAWNARSKKLSDLVILDVIDARMSGLDVCKAAQEQAPIASHIHAHRSRPRKWTRWWGWKSAPND